MKCLISCLDKTFLTMRSSFYPSIHSILEVVIPPLHHHSLPQLARFIKLSCALRVLGPCFPDRGPKEGSLERAQNLRRKPISTSHPLHTNTSVKLLCLFGLVHQLISEVGQSSFSIGIGRCDVIVHLLLRKKKGVICKKQCTLQR